jgi:lipopolysaccharide export system permease protein
LLKAAPGQFRAELHDRLIAPVYPFAFVVVAFVALCMPRTTRQGGMLSIVFAGTAVFGLRIFGFLCMALGQTTPAVLYAVYPAAALAIGLGAIAIFRGEGLELESKIDLSKLGGQWLGKITKFARLAPRRVPTP